MKVGDKLYLVNEGLNVRGNARDPEYVNVISVGRKYFKIDALNGVEFFIDGMHEKTEYVSNWTLYKSEQDYIDSLLKLKYRKLFRDQFGGWYGTKFTLKQYKEAAEIFGIDFE